MSDNTKATKQTVIEDGTEFEGSIRSKCSILLSGKVKGEVEAPTLQVTPSGSVDGQVVVEQLSSSGEISGEIDANTVELSGRVSDETVINARTLEVKLSQPDDGLRVSFGNCRLKVGSRSTAGKADDKAQAMSQKSEDKAQAQNKKPELARK